MSSLYAFGNKFWSTHIFYITTYIYISERRMEHIDNELERLNEKLTSKESIDNGTLNSRDIVKWLIAHFEIYSIGWVVSIITSHASVFIPLIYPWLHSNSLSHYSSYIKKGACLNNQIVVHSSRRGQSNLN